MCIHTRMAKEFGDSDDLSEWTRELDDYMAVGCYKVVKALNEEKMRTGDYLEWDEVLGVFRQSIYVDQSYSKHFNGRRSWDEMNYFKFDGSPDDVRKREIIAWLKDLFNKHHEQSIVDNSIVFNDGAVSHLASIAAQSGATVRDVVTLFAADDEEKGKVMEAGVIRFPTKWESYIKLYRITIYAWFKCSRVLFAQHDETGVEVHCEVYKFKVNTDTIDTSHARRARKKLEDPNILNF